MIIKLFAVSAAEQVSTGDGGHLLLLVETDYAQFGVQGVGFGGSGAGGQSGRIWVVVVEFEGLLVGIREHQEGFIIEVMWELEYKGNYCI